MRLHSFRMPELLQPQLAVAAADTAAGDTAWLLAAAALVLLMAPGLAFFYGGMVRSKSVLNMMMMVFGALAVVMVVWVLVGYSLAFGDDLGGGLVGDPTQFAGFKGMLEADPEVTMHLDPARLDALFDAESFLTHVDESFRRIGLLE